MFYHDSVTNHHDSVMTFVDFIEFQIYFLLNLIKIIILIIVILIQMSYYATKNVVLNDIQSFKSIVNTIF